METQDEYLDRICSIKPKRAKIKPKKDDENIKIFGYEWKDIQAMQSGTYKRKYVNK